MPLVAAEGQSRLTYAFCLDPTPCEVCKAGPCSGALDVVTLPTSEEHGASNLRRKATGLQTKASTPEPRKVYQGPRLLRLWRDQHTTSACMAEHHTQNRQLAESWWWRRRGVKEEGTGSDNQHACLFGSTESALAW